MARYHVVVYLVPDPMTDEQVPIMDEEFNSETELEDLDESVWRLIRTLEGPPHA